MGHLEKFFTATTNLLIPATPMPCVLQAYQWPHLTTCGEEKQFSLCRNLRHFPMPKSLCVTWLRQHRSRWTWGKARRERVRRARKTTVKRKETRGQMIPKLWQTPCTTCLFCQTLRQRTLDHGDGRESEREHARHRDTAQRAMASIGEQRRTLRYDTQNRYKTRIKLDSVIWPWMVRYVGFLCHEIRTWSEWHYIVQGSV